MYEDFLQVASVSKHQYKLAAFWRVLETKTNDQMTYNKGLIEEHKKRGLPETETSLWVEIPYSEFVNRSLGLYQTSSFQIAAEESERLGFSESRVLERKVNPDDPNSPMEKYKEYLFHADIMQAVINGGKYPTPVENNSPLLKERKKKTPVENNSTPPVENNSTPGADPLLKTTVPPVENNSNKYKKESSNKKNKERKNGSHTPTPSHHSSQESFSFEEKPEEEVEFSPEEQTIYDFGKETIYRVKPPKKTSKVQEQCAQIAKAGIRTLEQMKSLVAFTKQETSFKTLHLGNLINALNGWLLTQQFTAGYPPTHKSGTAYSSYDDDDYVDDTFYPTKEVIHATY
jgi:hypothetical protein